MALTETLEIEDTALGTANIQQSDRMQRRRVRRQPKIIAENDEYWPVAKLQQI